MKTSFYFVLWILIYPLLDLFGSRAVYENSFLLALIIVWGVSWLINRSIPGILRYERVAEAAPILEDIYSDRIDAFRRRLARQTAVEAFTGVYFCVSTFAIAVMVFKYGMSDWLALAIFAFFSFGIVARSVKLGKARASVSANPTQEQCADVADEIYHLNYAAYAERRNTMPYATMLPPKPRYYAVFQTVSLLFAAVCALLGLIFFVLGVVDMFSQDSMAFTAIASMTFLYGSLAAYFGIKDTASIIRSLRKKA